MHQSWLWHGDHCDAMWVCLYVQEKHGYSLTLAPSAIKHPRAGIGVWLQGHAPPGAVVAFYPGIAYTKPNYRCACCCKLHPHSIPLCCATPQTATRAPVAAMALSFRLCFSKTYLCVLACSVCFGNFLVAKYPHIISMPLTPLELSGKRCG